MKTQHHSKGILSTGHSLMITLYKVGLKRQEEMSFVELCRLSSHILPDYPAGLITHISLHACGTDISGKGVTV